LVDRRRALAGKVKGLHSGKEQETFRKEGKQRVKNGWLSRMVRKVMG
jgi:hypothetical protein